MEHLELLLGQRAEPLLDPRGEGRGVETQGPPDDEEVHDRLHAVRPEGREIRAGAVRGGEAAPQPPGQGLEVDGVEDPLPGPLRAEAVRAGR